MPEFIYNPSHELNSKCDFIFGHIMKDCSNKNLSIYVIDTNTSAKSPNSNIRCIGQISKEHPHPNQFNSDFIFFKRDNNSIELKAVHLPDFITLDTTYNTQIFLYDIETFEELSQRSDKHFKKKLSSNSDPISTLLQLIRNHKINDNRRERVLEHWMMVFLLMLSKFIRTKLKFINSAFLKHFLLWSANLERFTYQT